jgi:hypothetical protein
MENQSLNIVFQLSKKIMFNVRYYRCGGNTNKYFSTSADEFNQPKTDYTQCGQAQKTLLKGFGSAMSFYKKWGLKHLQDLNELEYNELLTDLSILKDKYNFIENDKDYSIGFNTVKEFSKQKVK